MKKTAIAALILFSIPAFAAGGPERPAHCWKRPGFSALNLSEDQKDRIFRIRYEDMPKKRDLLKSARKSREALDQLAASGHYDRNKAEEIAREGADAIYRLALLHAEEQSRIYALLDAGQKDEAKKLQRRPERF